MNAQRSLSLLGGTLGGFLAAYLLTNRELRHELGQAHSSSDVLHSMAKYMKRDARDVAAEARQAASVVGERASRYATVAGQRASRYAQSMADRLSAARREAMNEAEELGDQAVASARRVKRAANTGIASV